MVSYWENFETGKYVGEFEKYTVDHWAAQYNDDNDESIEPEWKCGLIAMMDAFINFAKKTDSKYHFYEAIIEDKYTNPLEMAYCNLNKILQDYLILVFKQTDANGEIDLYGLLTNNDYKKFCNIFKDIDKLQKVLSNMQHVHGADAVEVLKNLISIAYPNVKKKSMVELIDEMLKNADTDTSKQTSLFD